MNISHIKKAARDLARIRKEEAKADQLLRDAIADSTGNGKQSEFAEQVGVSGGNLTNIRQGKLGISDKVLAKILAA